MSTIKFGIREFAMSMTLLPEIREEDASPEIALIYADVRRCMRLPLVNLIYRHFATLPGVLPQIWGLVRAMILSGELGTALVRMNRDLPIPQMAPFDESMIGRLDHLNQATIRRVLQAYNRGNGLNLNALTAINLGLRQRRLGTLEIAEVVPNFEALPLPRLLKLTELDPRLADQLAHIAMLHDGGPGVVPSLCHYSETVRFSGPVAPPSSFVQLGPTTFFQFFRAALRPRNSRSMPLIRLPFSLAE